MTHDRLAHLRVLDLTQFLPGPIMTRMLADQGADVIKIEPPSLDPARGEAPFARYGDSDHSVWFANCNRGKRALTLDLKSEEGRERLAELCAEADVLVESFRPGVMARLGFDYASVAKIRPDIVYCSISAFGQNGPLASAPAHDLAVQALAGFLSVNDDERGDPVVPGVAASDMAAALTALSGVLMALLAREKSGEGTYLDIAMLDSLMPWCVHTASEAIAGGKAPVSHRQRSLGGAAMYQVYRTRDGKHIVLGARETKFARNLLSALGREDLLPLAEAPAGEQEELIAFLRERFAQKTRDEWIAWFKGRDIAFAPVLDFAEALRSEQLSARGLWIEAKASGERAGRYIASPLRFDGEPPSAQGAVPEPQSDLTWRSRGGGKGGGGGR